jgi:hypothetical protein
VRGTTPPGQTVRDWEGRAGYVNYAEEGPIADGFPWFEFS